MAARADHGERSQPERKLISPRGRAGPAEPPGSGHQAAVPIGTSGSDRAFRVYTRKRQGKREESSETVRPTGRARVASAGARTDCFPAPSRKPIRGV